MPAQFDVIPDKPAITLRNTCSECGQSLAEGKRVRCAACLDAIWGRLAAEDPAWYERHKQFQR